MRATWVCLSVSLPRQCVNYKKPRDDVHTHTHSRDGLPSFISRQHNGKGEREKNGSFYFWYLPGGCAPPCVCVCDMHIFQEGRYYWEFETFLSPLSARAILYDFVFIFVFFFFAFVKSHQDAVRACLLILFLNLRSSDSFFYLLAPRNKKKSPSVLNFFFLFFLPNISFLIRPAA